MELLRYRVFNFKSIIDSGWIECDKTTTLVGINESGKSNLLLGLWKLNPVLGGEIDPLHDLPVSKLSEYRNDLSNVKFISAEFKIPNDVGEDISNKLNIELIENGVVSISRYYDGKYEVECKNFEIRVKENLDEIEEVDTNNHVDLEIDDIIEKFDDEILRVMPTFVYYSNYGNLNSKIYLPHAIKWLSGKEVTGIPRNEDQIRTIKVLFDFVNLSPQEIYESGLDAIDLARRRNNYETNPSEKEIETARLAKEKRSILLQSASTRLTNEFKKWWKQGEYRFRLEADGDYFSIWVSDEKRPAEVDLSQRSTGLQWFLSFYLVFLVEKKGKHSNSILLLDEAGLTLHPLAQKDLVKFFEGLSEHNQIINTTHSPFIIDTSNIDRCRVVYSNENGETCVSSDLRASSSGINDKSIYAVHAAMGLSVSDILLQGCKPVIVEGPSDQYYLNMMKIILINQNKINPGTEIVFIPSGGVKNISSISSIVGGKVEELPVVLLDSDKSGMDNYGKLSKGLYGQNTNKLLLLKNYVDKENAEIEDLIPYILIKKAIDNIFRDVEDDDFEDYYDASKALVDQINSFANKNNIVLERGWKVELAKKAKMRIENQNVISKIKEEELNIMAKLFKDILDN